MNNRVWKIITLISVLLALICSLLLYISARARQPNVASIVTRVKPLNELTTVRYSIQRVIGIREAKQPFGEESLLLLVQGEVLAGVKLSDFSSRDVQFLNEHTVAIHLPAPVILQTFIDEKNTKVWDRQITWWTPWVGYDPDLEHKARLSALEEIKGVAISQGILDQAQKNAQISIRGFLNAIQIDVKFEGS